MNDVEDNPSDFSEWFKPYTLTYEEPISSWLTVHHWAVVSHDSQSDLITDCAPTQACADFCAAYALHHLTDLPAEIILN